MDEGLAEAFFRSLTLGPWSRPLEGAGDALLEGGELDAAMDVAAGHGRASLRPSALGAGQAKVQWHSVLAQISSGTSTRRRPPPLPHGPEQRNGLVPSDCNAHEVAGRSLMTVIPGSVFAEVGLIDHNTHDVSGRSLMTVMTQGGSN